MIPDKLYKQIVENVPIVCVDVILVHKGRYVLVKRANEPLKGEWWIVGGRCLKDEPTKETAKRKVKEEVGLVPTKLKIMGIYEDFYPKSAWGVPTHSVSIVYGAEVNKYNPLLDKYTSGIKLSNKLPKRLLSKLIKL